MSQVKRKMMIINRNTKVSKWMNGKGWGALSTKKRKYKRVFHISWSIHTPREKLEKLRRKPYVYRRLRAILEK